MSTRVRIWAQGEGGRVAQSLVHGLLLLEDIHVFANATEESLARRLQWHIVVVISYPFAFYLFQCMHIPFAFILIIIALSGCIAV